MNPHTMLTILEELCDEIARNGFRKILLANAYNGVAPVGCSEAIGQVFTKIKAQRLA